MDRKTFALLLLSVVLADTAPRFRIPACLIGASLLRDLQRGGETGW